MLCSGVGRTLGRLRCLGEHQITSHLLSFRLCWGRVHRQSIAHAFQQATSARHS